MKVETQLSLFLENKPGTLAAVCRAYAEEKINIQAISVSDAVDHAVVRVVVSDPRRAVHLLGERGVLVVERDVLMLESRNKPGELARIAQTLADHKVNIEYAYTATLPGASKGAMILRVDNLKKAERVLKRR
ncbi:MAG: ACT domain-containing protein [Verrucomicrobiia bacterium]